MDTNETLTSAGEKGSIFLNRIRKKKPIVPENSTSSSRMIDTSLFEHSCLVYLIQKLQLNCDLFFKNMFGVPGSYMTYTGQHKTIKVGSKSKVCESLNKLDHRNWIKDGVSKSWEEVGNGRNEENLDKISVERKYGEP